MSRLLLLGATAHEARLIPHLRRLGYATVVADWNPDGSPLSPARDVADSYVRISWNDTPRLADYCRQAGIDGIMAGFSEFRVEAMIRLCHATGLPCDISETQLALTRDKLLFKNLCRQCGLPVTDDPVIPTPDAFPLIVKPADRAGSIGISVVRDKENLKAALDYARSLSPSGSAVCERFMDGWRKVDLYYLLQRGRSVLVASDETLMIPPSATGGYELCQGAWLFPMTDCEAWQRKCGDGMERLFRTLGLKEGIVAVSAMRKGDDFRIFECALRLGGEHAYRYTERAFGVSFLARLAARAVGLDPQPCDYSSPRPLHMLMVNGYDMSCETPQQMPLASLVAGSPDALMRRLDSRPLSADNLVTPSRDDLARFIETR